MLEIVFTNDEKLKIEIFPRFAKWYEHFKSLNQLSGHYLQFNSKVEPFRRSSIQKITRKKQIQHNWNTILKTLYTLEHMHGVNHGLDLPLRFNFSQKMLNDIHRVFTYTSANSHLPNNLLDPINEAVHDIESYCSTNNKKFVLRQGKIQAVEFRGIYKDIGSIYKLNESELTAGSPIIDYKKGPPVLLNDFILGKPFIQAFYDQDNPNEFDITGRTVSDGGFVIDLNQNRQKLYTSLVFREWCAKHDLQYNNLPLETQIGYVKESTCSLNKLFYHFLLGFNLDRVEFK